MVGASVPNARQVLGVGGGRRRQDQQARVAGGAAGGERLTTVGTLTASAAHRDTREADSGLGQRVGAAVGAGAQVRGIGEQDAKAEKEKARPGSGPG